jgi:hypothetical protein
MAQALHGVIKPVKYSHVDEFRARKQMPVAQSCGLVYTAETTSGIISLAGLPGTRGYVFESSV